MNITKRKVAIRKGEFLDSSAGYLLKSSAVKRLCRKEITVDDLTESDFQLDIKQKGVAHGHVFLYGCSPPGSPGHGRARA